MVKTVEIIEEVDRQVIQSWGNNDALRITKKAKLSDMVVKGTHVVIHRAVGGFFVEVVEQQKRPTLEERLARFDVKRHGGELMADGLLGAETLHG